MDESHYFNSMAKYPEMLNIQYFRVFYITKLLFVKRDEYIDKALKIEYSVLIQMSYFTHVT